MKKFLTFCLALVTVVLSTVMPAFAAYNNSVDVNANIAYMISLDDEGFVMYDKNSDVKFNPAAIVKIVTGILAIEKCSDLNAKVVADDESIFAVVGTGSATSGLRNGEKLTVKELLYCTLVQNAADAAMVLAKYIAGSHEAFVEMMNGFAAELGCTSTKFVNPVGYGTEQYSTAKDVAAIFSYCMKNSTFAQIIGTTYYEIEPTEKYNETRYVKTSAKIMDHTTYYYSKHVRGAKTGITDDDRSNAVSVASKDGYNYLCVVMDAPYTDTDGDGYIEEEACIASRKLYNWTFENIRLRVVVNPNTRITETNVRLSNQYDHISLVPAKEVSALVPSAVGTESVLIEPIEGTVPEYVNAPIKKGDVIGRAAVKYAGQTVVEIDLCAAFDVSASPLKTFGDMCLRVIKSLVFKIIIGIAFVAAAVFIVLCIKNGKIKTNIKLKKGAKKKGAVKQTEKRHKKK